MDGLQGLMPGQTWQVLVVLASAAAGAWLAGVLMGVLVGRLARRSPLVADISRRGRTPLRALLVLAAATVVLDAAPSLGGWREPVVRVLGLALIASVGWLLGVVAFVAADLPWRATTSTSRTTGTPAGSAPRSRCCAASPSWSSASSPRRRCC
jgi:amino acid transporter